MKQKSNFRDCQLAFFAIIFILCCIYLLVLLCCRNFRLSTRSGSTQQIDSVKIVYCYKTFECPAAVLPQWFENGAFLRYRDSLVIKDCDVSNRLYVDLNNLRRYKENKDSIDTRGKITLYFSDQTKQVWYYNRFFLQQKDDSICYKWTRKMKLFLNSIVHTNKKLPIFQKKEMDVRYDDEFKRVLIL